MCPQFRILIIGNTGTGKSSLVSSDIDKAPERAKAITNIELGYTSRDNPRFILHDSQGFSSGCTASLDIVEQFLRDRSSCTELKDRIHAIWLCVETPRIGFRIPQTNDEKISSLAKELNIPILVLFTKFDMLVKQHVQNAKDHDTLNSDPLKEAEKDFKTRINDLKASTTIDDYVWISTKPEYSSSLTNLAEVTRKKLHNMEGELWLSWATAQQLSARQKVDQSIREGCKKYWLNLSKSSVLHGQPLTECLSRIHQDIVNVWNFYDPDDLLSDHLLAKVTELTQTFTPIPNSEAQTARDNDWLAHYSDAMTLVNAIGTSVAQAVGGLGIAIVVLKYFYRTYRAVEPSAQYIGAYIINLTLTLYRMFETMLPKDPPCAVTEELIKDTLEHYRTTDCVNVHRSVRELTLGHFEVQMTQLAKENL